MGWICLITFCFDYTGNTGRLQSESGIHAALQREAAGQIDRKPAPDKRRIYSSILYLTAPPVTSVTEFPSCRLRAVFGGTTASCRQCAASAPLFQRHRYEFQWQTGVNSGGRSDESLHPAFQETLIFRCFSVKWHEMREMPGHFRAFSAPKSRKNAKESTIHGHNFAFVFHMCTLPAESR